MRPKVKKLILIAPLALLGMAAFAAIGSELVRVLWNWLLPTLFGWKTITFWQGFGLLALCRILFGGRHSSFSGRSAARQRIRERMAQRWEKMTPEERERYRRSFGARWSSFEPPPDPKANA